MRRISLLMGLFLAGCSRNDEPQGPADRSYKMVGLVRDVDAAKGEVTIRHEAIPGFMGSMTMTLPVADRADLDEVRPGDEVEATLRIQRGRSDLASLSVTRPALPGSENAPSDRFASPRPKPLETGEIVPDFEWKRQDGTSSRLSELKGKVIVLTFVYTRCPLPDFCPLMDRRFKELASKIALVPGRSEKVRLVSMSFDPDHDTPEVLARHARTQGAKGPLWTFGVANHEELARVSGSLGLTYLPGKDDLRHNLSTSIIGVDGRLIRRFSGRDWSVDDLLGEVRRALDGRVK